MTKIIIHVSGGLVQWVASDKQDVQIAIVDMDNIETGGNEMDQIQIGNPDISVEDAYTEKAYPGHPEYLDNMDIRIKDYLKENGF